MADNHNTSIMSVVGGLSRKRTIKGIQKSISDTVKKVVKKPQHSNSCGGGGGGGGARSNETMFRYGNYNRYYGYRNENLAEDQRLSVFKKEWFEGELFTYNIFQILLPETTYYKLLPEQCYPIFPAVVF